jgi:DNA-binding transcriptional LysR family regulator
MLTGSRTNAAETLRTAQPTVSRLLADFAAAGGFPLVRRDGRNVVPTADARALCAEIEKHYRGLREIEQAAARIRYADGARLGITSVTSLALSLLPLAIRRFAKIRPAVPLTVESGNYETILGRLAGRQCDIGLAIATQCPAEVEARPLIAARAVCVASADNPVAKKAQLTAADLADAPLIMVGRLLPGGRIIDSLISAPFSGRAPFIEVQSGAIACALAAQGLGIAVVDALTVSGIHDSRLAVRPLEPPVELRYSVLTARGRGDDRLLAAFHAALDEAVVELVRVNAHVTSLVSGGVIRTAAAGTSPRRAPAPSPAGRRSGPRRTAEPRG